MKTVYSSFNLFQIANNGSQTGCWAFKGTSVSVCCLVCKYLFSLNYQLMPNNLFIVLCGVLFYFFIVSLSYLFNLFYPKQIDFWLGFLFTPYSIYIFQKREPAFRFLRFFIGIL